MGPRKQISVLIKFDKHGLPSLSKKSEYPEWVIDAVDRWRSSVMESIKDNG